MWDQTRYALEFFQTYLPFWEMEPADHLISVKDAYCFAKEGDVYAIYLQNGETTVLDLGSSDSEYRIKWYNPRTGAELVDGSVKVVHGPGKVSVGHPPQDNNQDWAVLVKRQD